MNFPQPIRREVTGFLVANVAAVIGLVTIARSVVA